MHSYTLENNILNFRTACVMVKWADTIICSGAACHLHQPLEAFEYPKKNSYTIINSLCSFFVSQHPNFDEGPGFGANDISVVKTTSLISGSNIAPGTIAPNADNPETIGWITGWGRTCGM